MTRDSALPESFTVVEHPLIQHKLTLMREKDTSTAVFRQLLREISQLLAYEVTRELPMTTKLIDTPLTDMEAPVLAGRKLALISILRAGNGLLDGMLELIPSARVGFVGLYRDEATLKPVQYYFKVPDELGKRMVIAVDPMLATGGSAALALDVLQRWGVPRTRLVVLIAAPEGIAAVSEQFPETEIITAQVDESRDALSAIGADGIRPGFGHCGHGLWDGGSHHRAILASSGIEDHAADGRQSGCGTRNAQELSQSTPRPPRPVATDETGLR